MFPIIWIGNINFNVILFSHIYVLKNVHNNVFQFRMNECKVFLFFQMINEFKIRTYHIKTINTGNVPMLLGGGSCKLEI